MFHVDPASLDASPAPAGPDAACAQPADPRALIERQIAALSRLAEIGMEIAEAAGRAAADPAADETARTAFPDPTLAYTRAARAVRLTFALQAQLLKDLGEVETAEAKQTYDRTVRRRMHLVRLVEDGLKVEHDLDARTVGRFGDDVRERLREADEDERLLGLPFAEVLAQICEDLQLSPERTAQVMTAAALPVIPDGPSGPIRDPGAAVASGALGPGSSLRCGRDDRKAPPEDDEGDTFLEWPPPSG